MKTQLLKKFMLFSVLMVCFTASAIAQSTPDTAKDTEQVAGQVTGQAEKSKNRVPGPMITPTAWPGGGSIPAGKLALIEHVTMSHSSVRKGTRDYTNRDAAGVKAGQKSSDTTVNVFKIRYGIVDRWDARISIPFINKDIQRHEPQGGMWRGGFADPTAILRYQILKATPDNPFCIALDAGAILPLGQVGEKHIANNAWGFTFGGGASWVDLNQRVDWDAQYVVNTEGARDITNADYFISHLHYAYALSDYFDIGAESSFKVAEASKVKDVRQGNAYSELYGGPKVQWKMPQWSSFTLGAAVLFPMYRDYDKASLSDDARFEFRTALSF